MSRKYVGSDQILHENGLSIEQNKENGTLCLQMNGWTILLCDESPIANSEYLEQLEEETKEFHLPSMVFFNNFLQIKNVQTAIGFTLTPKDALLRWAELSKQFGSRGLKVPSAWKTSNTREVQSDRRTLNEQNPFDFDWTFSTDFCGKLFHEKSLNQITLLDENNSESNEIDKKEQENNQQKVDDGENNITLEWQVSDESGIDLQMLSRRDPFLFFDEIAMYRDELDDWGDVELNVKIRVMPTCWFVLQRYYLRLIDTSLGNIYLVKIFDVRFFHAFGTSTIHREITVREGNTETLAHAGLPSDINSYKQIDAIAQRIPLKPEESMFHRLDLH